MSYIENNLLPGEKIMYKTRLHWSVLIGPFAFAFLVALPGAALLFFEFPDIRDPRFKPIQTYAGFAFLFLAVCLLIRGLLIRNSTEMSVTNKRLVIKTGLFGRRTIELLLGKVESVQVLESFVGRMVGYGTIIVHGTGGTPESFHKIAHPLEFRRQIEQQVETRDK
jgi:hypothetical protein